jgi:hypothetical protein
MCICIGVTMERAYRLIASSSEGTDDVQDARQIVGEDAQRHLGGDLGKRLHQEVSCADAHLRSAERVLGGLALRAHSVRILGGPPR